MQKMQCELVGKIFDSPEQPLKSRENCAVAFAVQTDRLRGTRHIREGNPRQADGLSGVETPLQPICTGIPIIGQISQTNRARTTISSTLAGIPATKNSLVVNNPLL
jgi:hypothetical protein